MSFPTAMKSESRRMSRGFRFPRVHRGANLVRFLFVFFVFFEVINCSSAPIRVKCGEMRARLEIQNLNEDQRRFAEKELEACLAELETASKRDSTALRKFDNRLPEDSL